MTGFRVVLLLAPLLAIAAEPAAPAAATRWRPAEHPAPVLRPIAGLTRPVRVLAIAAEVAGRVVDPGPPVGSEIPPGAALRLDPVLAEADRAVAAAQAVRATAEAAFRGREAARLARLAAEGRIGEAEHAAATHAAEAARLAAEAAAAELARAEALLARRSVPLPAGWRVLRRHREAGAVVQPGEPVLEAGDPAAVSVLLHLGEDEIAALPAAVATVGGRTWPVLAVRVPEQADALSRKRPVELELSGAAGGGREAVVLLSLPDPLGALAVPAGLLRGGADGSQARTADGRLLRVTVLREAGPGLLAVLPTPELAAAELVAP